LGGFRIADPQQAAELRKIASGYIGQRIVIGDNQPGVNQDAQLTYDGAFTKVAQPTAAALRPELEAIQSSQNPLLIAIDGPDMPRSAARLGSGTAKALATILLTNRPSALIYYGQETGLTAAAMVWGTAPAQKPAGARKTAVTNDPLSVAAQDADQASLLSWYRQLSALHQSNRTLSSAPGIVLNHDDQNVLAWVRKPEGASLKNPPVVVICNLSAQPVHLSLKDDMQKLHLRGNFIRTMLRSDNGMGPMTLDSMTLQPNAVYIGQLRY